MTISVGDKVVSDLQEIPMWVKEQTIWNRRMEHKAEYKADTLHVALTACGSGEDVLPAECVYEPFTGLPCPLLNITESTVAPHSSKLSSDIISSERVSCFKRSPRR